MKTITLLGCGLVGRTIAHDLSNKFRVTVIDKDESKLKKISDTSPVSTVQADIDRIDNFSEILADSDIVVSAVPGSIGYKTLEKVIRAGKDIVDISFFSEDPFTLNELAKQKNITAVVDCGIAPGLSNIILGFHTQKMDVNSYRCYVGGLPFRRTFPFEYKAPFSPSDVIEEYLRDARFVHNGKIIVKEALSDSEIIEFEKAGKLEAFNTDGLRTLIKTMNIPDMIEKTLRYPKHVEYIKVLKSAGFFNKEPVEISGCLISPVDFTSKLLFSQWELTENEPEFTVLRLIISGIESGNRTEYLYNLFDEYDPVTGFTSMARTTGFTCCAVVKLIAENKFRRKGICPPEYIGMQAGCFEEVKFYLKERNVNYSVTKKQLN
ncbi:MAG: saccharopine dehydrogenase family protein [Ignavibacteriaceae bacterium]